jgi:hypothetical protein
MITLSQATAALPFKVNDLVGTELKNNVNHTLGLVTNIVTRKLEDDFFLANAYVDRDHYFSMIGCTVTRERGVRSVEWTPVYLLELPKKYRAMIKPYEKYTCSQPHLYDHPDVKNFHLNVGDITIYGGVVEVNFYVRYITHLEDLVVFVDVRIKGHEQPFTYMLKHTPGQESKWIPQCVPIFIKRVMFEDQQTLWEGMDVKYIPENIGLKRHILECLNETVNKEKNQPTIAEIFGRTLVSPAFMDGLFTGKIKPMSFMTVEKKNPQPTEPVKEPQTVTPDEEGTCSCNKDFYLSHYSGGGNESGMYGELTMKVGEFFVTYKPTSVSFGPKTFVDPSPEKTHKGIPEKLSQQIDKLHSELVPQPKEDKPNLPNIPSLITAALYDFVGYATTQKTTLEIGENAPVPPVVELLKKFLRERGLQDDILISNWDKEFWNDRMRHNPNKS